MKYGSQFSPISGTRESCINLPSREPREALSPISNDTQFFRSWMVYHFDREGRENHSWNLALGFALAVTVSVIFWVGLGSLILRLWK